MFNLGELLSLAGLYVTFLNSDQIDRRLRRCTDLHARLGSRKNIRFRTISDGQPADHLRSVGQILELHASLKEKTKQLIREMQAGQVEGDNENWPRISCLIADGIMSFAIDVAGEFGIPSLLFRTSGAACFWVCLCVPKLVEAGELPFGEATDLDHAINCIPGMEGQLRPRDLPSFCQVKDLNSHRLNFFLSEFERSSRASGLIFNSFYDLEHTVLNQVSTRFANVYAVGPLHSLVRSQNLDHSVTSGTSSLRKEDLSCIDWLGRWGRGCVLYVSFGSHTQINGDELLEFFHGLVNAGFPFLWVIRTDLVTGELGSVPKELLEALQTRGCVVEWAPQEEVLAHPSVGGFFTHNGWNSTMESICSGVPMLCWPSFADQPLNCRFVSHVWKIGLDMQRMCSRTMIERLVRELMAEKREELWESATRMKERAWKSIQDGGSSINDFHKLVDDIRSMTAPKKIELSPFDNTD
ncbi:7-deoxyloganetic acid glucosyltransferase-like [Nymphaea colorata]|uniref:7-deoxyloganetic acid glucosyltransferase-like n=1 Tax=Nymphaea colorata TaxID=210225 RepID=UPI00214F3E5B|nr:7-deoxyloganetic acid glucosyltransferase-like [Nymphaea colorata]